MYTIQSVLLVNNVIIGEYLQNYQAFPVLHTNNRNCHISNIKDIQLFFRFCVGDRFFLCDNKILCEYDYEERMVFANLAYNQSNLAHIKQQARSVAGKVIFSNISYRLYQMRHNADLVFLQISSKYPYHCNKMVWITHVNCLIT